jgi:uncharacterized protein YbjT (DUF2867 family)
MSRTLLITGATGSVSSALLAALAGSRLDIRAMVRDQAKAAPLRDRGVQVVVGDLDDPSTLPPAFAGVHDLWLLVPNGPRAPENSMNALWAARQAGVDRVVRLSAVGAAHDAPTRSGRLHALSDGELRACGTRWTILRPHWFMQNLLNEVADISARGTFSLNAGDGRLGMIDVRDVAQFAARVLTDGSPRHDGRTYTLTGPRPVSFADVADRLGRVLGTPVAYVPVPAATQRETLLGNGVPAWITDMLVEYGQAYAAGWGDHTSDDFLDVVGHPPRDVEDFLRDHAAAFS